MATRVKQFIGIRFRFSLGQHRFCIKFDDLNWVERKVDQVQTLLSNTVYSTFSVFILYLDRDEEYVFNKRKRAAVITGRLMIHAHIHDIHIWRALCVPRSGD